MRGAVSWRQAMVFSQTPGQSHLEKRNQPQQQVLSPPPAETFSQPPCLLHIFLDKEIESSIHSISLRQLLRLPAFLEAQHPCHAVVGLMLADVLRTREHKFCRRRELLAAFAAIQREQNRCPALGTAHAEIPVRISLGPL